jgi:hypothetical protein
MILVQKPYMERRTYATFAKQWKVNGEAIDIKVTSPQLSLKEYINNEFPLELVISCSLNCIMIKSKTGGECDGG